MIDAYITAMGQFSVSAAVQLHEAKSRRSISIITFYGGVASSLTWLSIHPLLEAAGLTGTCLVISGALVFASLMIGNAARRALVLVRCGDSRSHRARS